MSLARFAYRSELIIDVVFLNIITELIAGYAWPGKPIANMLVKCYGYNSVVRLRSLGILSEAQN